MTKKRIILIIIIIFLIALCICCLFFLKKRKTNEPLIIKQEDIISNYNYTIKANDSKLKKQKFQELKEILSKDDINYDDYAQKLAEIFVVDVYDLSVKINKYDVGGLEYVLDDQKDKLKSILQDTLYNHLQDNVENNRQQTLPVVVEATSEKYELSSYSYSNEKYDAYIVNVLIDYEKDLGYDKNVVIKLIKKDDRLFVVAIEPK